MTERKGTAQETIDELVALVDGYMTAIARCELQLKNAPALAIGNPAGPCSGILQAIRTRAVLAVLQALDASGQLSD